MGSILLAFCPLSGSLHSLGLRSLLVAPRCRRYNAVASEP